jgi:hypothetical protein
MYVDGIRRDGETSIAGAAPSRLRHLANKLTFVPANHAYNEWLEVRTPMRISYLYLDPSKLDRSCNEDTAYAPKVFCVPDEIYAPSFLQTVHQPLRDALTVHGAKPPLAQKNHLITTAREFAAIAGKSHVTRKVAKQAIFREQFNIGNLRERS